MMAWSKIEKLGSPSSNWPLSCRSRPSRTGRVVLQAFPGRKVGVLVDHVRDGMPPADVDPMTPSSPRRPRLPAVSMYFLWSFAWPEGQTSSVASTSPDARAGNCANSSISSSSTVQPICAPSRSFWPPGVGFRAHPWVDRDRHVSCRCCPVVGRRPAVRCRVAALLDITARGITSTARKVRQHRDGGPSVCPTHAVPFPRSGPGRFRDGTNRGHHPAPPMPTGPRSVRRAIPIACVIRSSTIASNRMRYPRHDPAADLRAA